jgi:hypothetical protein
MESPVSSHACRQAVGSANLAVRKSSKPVAERSVFTRQPRKFEHFWKASAGNRGGTESARGGKPLTRRQPLTP